MSSIYKYFVQQTSRFLKSSIRLRFVILTYSDVSASSIQLDLRPSVNHSLVIQCEQVSWLHSVADLKTHTDVVYNLMQGTYY